MSRLQEAKDLLVRTEGHTPGPWRAHPDWRGGKFSSIEGNGLSESVAEIPHDDCDSKQFRTIKKNVALIAAAPALRELLAAMVAEVERLGCNIRVEAGLAWEEGFDSGSLAHENSGNHCDWEEAEERLKDEAHATWAFSWRPQ